MLNEQLFKIKGNDLKNSCSISGYSTESSAEKQPIVILRHIHKSEFSSNCTHSKTKTKSNHFRDYSKTSCSVLDLCIILSGFFFQQQQEQILTLKALLAANGTIKVDFSINGIFNEGCKP